MSPTPTRRRRRLSLVGAAVGAVLIAGSAPAGPAAADDTPYPDRVTLMGSLQSEAGCEADWDEACRVTDLRAVAGTRSFQWVGTLPAGSYEFKVRLNGSWAENYGKGGALDGANVPLVLLETARLRFTYDHDSHAVSVAPAVTPPARQAQDRLLAQSSLREDLTRERFYFVMADRFENGDPTNDLGDYPADRSVSGFDPTDRAFYHGGDLAGILERLDYIQGMGTTAIWLTPSFKNKPVQGTGADMSAGYHGYWITDFTQIDPHLGTNEELEELVDAAHERGMKVFFDIITNHTADVIQYAEDTDPLALNRYISKQREPYRDADGEPFDDREFAGTDTFPALDPQVSFPYTPVVPDDEADVKVPAWLNDPIYYHNRGDALFDGGESDLYGDFASLDDLFTEHPQVVEGMKEIYKAWVDFGIDGFRIDTVKHVNMEFWQDFAPAIVEHAAATGNSDFFSFAEVFDSNPRVLSRFTGEGQIQSVLDFGYQARGSSFANGRRTDDLSAFFAEDDYYIDADSNAYSLPTFLGNHDMGRIGYFIQRDNEGASDDELLERDLLAHSLMYLTRGQPVVFYGDEQGFTGTGGDKLARQDMFPSQVAEYNDDDLIGTIATPAQSNFNGAHPIYRHLRELSQLRDEHPTLADGAQVQRYASDAPGVFAFSRIDDADDVEYVVALNNSEEPQTVTFDTFRARTTFRAVWPLGTRSVRSDADKQVTVTVPPLSAAVYRAATPLPRARQAVAPEFTAQPGSGLYDRAEVAVDVPGGGFNQVTFAYRPVGARGWTVIGTDDNAPYRVFHDVRGFEDGTLLEYRAVVRDHSGNRAAASWSGAVTATPPPTGPEEPVEDPETVSLAGTFNTEMGCPEDWMPSCELARLTLDPETGLWTGTFDLPDFDWGYKVAYDGSWDVNFGANGARNGDNIPLATTGGPVTFTYDPESRLVTVSGAVPGAAAADAAPAPGDAA